MRKCSTCQHTKRAEIDRRLAAGEPGNQIARDYDLNPSSLHRHRVNCLGLSSSNAIMKEVARGTAAITCLPSKDELNNAYFELRARIDQIVSQADSKARSRLRFRFQGRRLTCKRMTSFREIEANRVMHSRVRVRRPKTRNSGRDENAVRQSIDTKTRKP